jgi:hypothetical protein
MLAKTTKNLFGWIHGEINEKLKAYYFSCGFTYLKQKYLPQPNNLPQHYWVQHLVF